MEQRSILLKIENWLITDKGIEWNGVPEVDYFISKDSLNQTRIDSDGILKYDWLLHMVGKTWLKPLDIYALNTAFVYSLSFFNIGFDPQISFTETINDQKKLIEVLK